MGRPKLKIKKENNKANKQTTLLDFVKVEPRVTKPIPDVLYSEDGDWFYPCKFCCKAFADKSDLDEHVPSCSINSNDSPQSYQGHPSSNKENDCDSSVDLSSPDSTPLTRSKVQAEQSRSAEILASFSNRLSLDNHFNTRNIPGTMTNVVRTGTVSQNINNLNDEMRAKVLENINALLEGSSVSIIIPEDSDGSIIVQTATNDIHPALQLTSRNLDLSCVEIKTTVTGMVDYPAKMPELAEILEKNFGTSKLPFEADSSEYSKHLKSKPKSIHNESLLDESELGEMEIDEVDLDGTIVLEDLDIHICKQCRSVYHTLEDLVNHDKYEHRNLKRRYPQSELEKFDIAFKSSKHNMCPICFKVLSTKTAWPRHLQTHNDVPNYECRICKRKFTRNDHRKLHEKRHVVPLDYNNEVDE